MWATDTSGSKRLIASSAEYGRERGKGGEGDPIRFSG